MSTTSGSPTSLNLRDFRLQKKVLSHKNSSNGEEMDSKVRRRIITLEDSDSDEDSSGRSDSPSKKDIIIKLNSKVNGTKSPVVVEKEKQMKLLIAKYPKVDALLIHDILSKHAFNVETAEKEINMRITSEDMQTKALKWSEQKVEQLPQNGVASLKRKHEESEKRSKVKRRKERYSSGDSDDCSKYNNTSVYNSDEDSDEEVSNKLTGDKKKVLDFFEEATLAELQLMNSCSKKKAELINSLRPFKNWINLVETLKASKGVGSELLNAAQQVLSTRNNIKNLMKKCTGLGERLERAVAAGTARLKRQPPSLSPQLQLTKYQMVGLNWLTVLHAQGVNGILADEMGLGKTIQVISFLAHLKEIGAANGTHLVIVPASTLDNWKAEFHRWCPQLRVFMYYGSLEERRQFRFEIAKGMLKDFDVILTTYTTVTNAKEERKMFHVTPLHYVVFDEAHMLKNMNTQRYENLVRINAKNRILLTGTPLQNNLLELMSLLIFVMPKIFAEKRDDLKNLFQKNAKIKQEDTDQLPPFERDQVEQAKRIMKPFVLRRLKIDVLQDLPKKTEHITYITLPSVQRQQYEDLVEFFQKAGTEGNTSYSGMTMMSDLRKLSNHPLLVRHHYDHNQIKEMATRLAADSDYKDTVVQYIIDDLTWMSDFDIHTMSKQFSSIRKYGLPDNLLLFSGKFLQLDKVLPELKTNGHRVLIFSQYVIMLNIMEEYMRLRKYNYLRLDGNTAVHTRQELINEFNEDSSIFVFLLSTKAGGLGINLTAADTVIIHDIDFNPYNDKQAEDRCHRMGQTKPVTVYRFIAEGTIEEGMLQMNKEKLKLEREITTDETDDPDVKSVVRLLSSALGIETSKATNLVSPPPKPTKKSPFKN